jgi:hypothetical protein
MTQQPGNAPPEKVRELIMRALQRYPRMNISMLTPIVRPYQRLWKHTLEAMVQDGTVIRESDLSGARLVFSYRLADEEMTMADATTGQSEPDEAATAAA